MKIQVLGTRGEIKASAPHHTKKSGVLIDDKILLDVGDESFLAYHPEAILITHLHPDHAFFVRNGHALEIDSKIFAPEHYQNMAIEVPTHSFKIGDYAVQPIPTIHSIKVKSQGYLITHRNKKIFYTGDMIWIDKKYHRLLQGCDLVITEASHVKKGGLVRRKPETGEIFGHTGMPDLMHFFKPYTHTILFVHFGSWFFDDIEQSRSAIQRLADEQEIQSIIGYDGLIINI